MEKRCTVRGGPAGRVATCPGSRIFEGVHAGEVDPAAAATTAAAADTDTPLKINMVKVTLSRAIQPRINHELSISNHSRPIPVGCQVLFSDE
jgi:hypothetical protein